MTSLRRIGALALLCAISACAAPWQRQQADHSYYTQSRVWTDEQGRPVGGPSQSAPTQGAPDHSQPPSPVVRSQEETPLELYQTAQREIESRDAELLRLREQLASMMLTVEQLREDNARVQSANETMHSQREGVREQLAESERSKAELEEQLRSLADELLTERIARLRVERDLVLAKIEVADTASGDP